jgi:hypothetical protein
MSTKKRNLKATEVDLQASEAKATEAEMVSFEKYIAKAKVNPGLVASFKYEALKAEKGLQERSEDEWKRDFEAQANRAY